MTTLAKRHIVVGHFVRSDTGHVMQAIGVTRHSRITQQLVPSTTLLSFICCSQFACKKKLLMTFGTTLVILPLSYMAHIPCLVHRCSVMWSARCSTMSVIFTIRRGWLFWRLQCGQSSDPTSHTVDRLAGYVTTLYQLLDLSANYVVRTMIQEVSR